MGVRLCRMKGAFGFFVFKAMPLRFLFFCAFFFFAFFPPFVFFSVPFFLRAGNSKKMSFFLCFFIFFQLFFCALFFLTLSRLFLFWKRPFFLKGFFLAPFFCPSFFFSFFVHSLMGVLQVRVLGLATIATRNSHFSELGVTPKFLIFCWGFPKIFTVSPPRLCGCWLFQALGRLRSGPRPPLSRERNLKIVQI